MTISLAVQERFAYASDAIRHEIRQAARATGADFAYMMAKAQVESGFRPEVEAKTSSATGLYQFTRATWLEMIQKYGAEHGYGKEAAQLKSGASEAEITRILDLRKNPHAAAHMAAEYAHENAARLEDRLGRKPDGVELYLAHFLGGGGAARFLKAHAENPQAEGVALLPRAAAANRAIFYAPGTGQPRTLDEIKSLFAHKLGLSTEPKPDQSPAPPALASTTKPEAKPWHGHIPPRHNRTPLHGHNLSWPMIMALHNLTSTLRDI